MMGAVPAVVWITAVVAAVHLHQRIRTSAVLKGFAEDQPVTIAHLEPGVVRDVHVQLHEQVSRGQVLISIDDREERIRLAAIEKDIERLRAQVVAERASLSADNARAIADVEDLARRFAIDREAAHVDYLSQLAVNARNLILLRWADVELEITRGLRDQNSAAYREFNDIETEAESLRAELDKSTEALDRMKTAFDEEDQRWFHFVERQDVATAFEPVLTPLRLAIDVRRRDLEEVVRRIDTHVLRAPIDGQVTGLLAHTGDSIQAGDPLAMVSPFASNRVVAYLPEHMVLYASVGAPVSIDCAASVEGGRREYRGMIVSLSATVAEAPPRYRQTPTYPVWGRTLVATLTGDVCLIPGEAVTLALLDRRCSARKAADVLGHKSQDAGQLIVVEKRLRPTYDTLGNIGPRESERTYGRRVPDGYPTKPVSDGGE